MNSEIPQWVNRIVPLRDLQQKIKKLKPESAAVIQMKNSKISYDLGLKSLIGAVLVDLVPFFFS